MSSRQCRSVYMHDQLWRELKAKLALEGKSVSAWVREQAQSYVKNGHDQEPDIRKDDPALLISEQEGENRG